MEATVPSVRAAVCSRASSGVEWLRGGDGAGWFEAGSVRMLRRRGTVEAELGVRKATRWRRLVATELQGGEG